MSSSLFCQWEKKLHEEKTNREAAEKEVEKLNKDLKTKACFYIDFNLAVFHNIYKLFVFIRSQGHSQPSRANLSKTDCVCCQSSLPTQSPSEHAVQLKYTDVMQHIGRVWLFFFLVSFFHCTECTAGREKNAVRGSFSNSFVDTVSSVQ